MNTPALTTTIAASLAITTGLLTTLQKEDAREKQAVHERSATEWLPELAPALAIARADGRPLFVTMRCLPCKQCVDFDAAVLEGGPDLDPLLKQFVTVRLTDAAQIDLRVFPVESFQDLDLSWWGWFLSPTGEVYGTFGGRDEVSDKTRISKQALINTLKRVLAHHNERSDAAQHQTGKPLDPDSPVTVRNLPGWDSWSTTYPAAVESQTCVHCHQIVEVLRQPAIDAGTFTKPDDLYVWPLPENVGFSLDRDHGLRVTRVDDAGPAAAAGLQPHDVLVRANGELLFSQTDLRGALHRLPDTASGVTLTWLRDATEHEGVVELGGDWRKTVLDWRMSVSQGNVGAHPGFWPNRASGDDRRRFSLTDNQMAIRPWFGPNQRGPARAAGLRGNDTIVAVNGQSPNLAGRPFLVWLRMQTEPGDTLTLDVRRADGSSASIRYILSNGH